MSSEPARHPQGYNHHRGCAELADDTLPICSGDSPLEEAGFEPSVPDPTQPAFVAVNELLRKHFAVLGTTGSGKSCAVSLLLSAILADYPMAHILLIDPHDEYGRVFGKIAEVVNVNNLQLPFWLFDFEEAAGILVRGGTAQEQ
jgi:hypothetical protein